MLKVAIVLIKSNFTDKIWGFCSLSDDKFSVCFQMLKDVDGRKVFVLLETWDGRTDRGMAENIFKFIARNRVCWINRSRVSTRCWWNKQKIWSSWSNETSNFQWVQGIFESSKKFVRSFSDFSVILIVFAVMVGCLLLNLYISISLIRGTQNVRNYQFLIAISHRKNSVLFYRKNIVSWKWVEFWQNFSNRTLWFVIKDIIRHRRRISLATFISSENRLRLWRLLWTNPKFDF